MKPVTNDLTATFKPSPITAFATVINNETYGDLMAQVRKDQKVKEFERSVYDTLARKSENPKSECDTGFYGIEPTPAYSYKFYLAGEKLILIVTGNQDSYTENKFYYVNRDKAGKLTGLSEGISESSDEMSLVYGEP